MQGLAFCGHVVRSAVPLPELEPWPSPPVAAQSWTCGPLDVPEGELRPVHRWLTDDGATWVDIDASGNAYVLRFSLGVTFVVEGTSIGWDRRCEAPVDTVRHLLLDQVLPLAMSARGEYALHAAAVEMGGRAIVIAAPSGTGKSTLAASCLRRGARLLADDCVRVTHGGDAFRAHASYPGLRLWSDSADKLGAPAPSRVAHYTTKQRIAWPARDGHVPIGRIYLLGRTRTADVHIAPADASSAIDLTRFVFRIDPRHRAHIASDFAVTSALVNGGIVRRLIVPDSLESLGQVVDAIEQETAPGGAPAA